ncbi:MAG: hydroxymethylpyrimidine/phosphomethylpyrimidine kinase [Rhizobiaceae bacterium MnEN-MB40S]|nr:MAG: hydroxymethylpyrimidine/phosphomethylpyrimidine kinase [Rhizobiaceae bacterium MnEN-MB40S]
MLVVGGTDSSGGAGISRDVATLAAFGVAACPAITAVTAQTHHGVRHVEAMSADLIRRQMDAAKEANPIGVVKIGMLGHSEAIRAVASFLEDHRDIPAVLDPVLVSSSGGRLTDEAAVADLGKCLLPLCTLATPNLPELASLLAEPEAQCASEAERQGRALLRQDCRAVLVKGGHAGGDVATDMLFRHDSDTIAFSAPRLNGSLRGTGCMLASAIAAGLASGESLESSVRSAKAYVFDRIAEAATG